MEIRLPSLVSAHDYIGAGADRHDGEQGIAGNTDGIDEQFPRPVDANIRSIVGLDGVIVIALVFQGKTARGGIAAHGRGQLAGGMGHISA